MKDSLKDLKELEALQLEIEAESLSYGVTRYRRAKANKDETDMKPGQHLANVTVRKLVDAITAEKASHRARRGKPSIFMPYFDLFDSEVLAEITARVVINTLSRQPARLSSLAISVGSALEQAHTYRELKPTEPHLFRAMKKKADKATTRRHKHNVMQTAVRTAKAKHGFNPEQDWTENHKLRVGMKLVELMIERTGLIEAIEKRTSSTKSMWEVRATPYMMEWLDKMHLNCELAAPIRMPMAVPPKPWTLPIGGGYLGIPGSPSLPIVKTRQKGLIDDLFSTDMPEVYDAVNRVQETPWKVNTAVLDVILGMIEDTGGIAGLPPGRDLPLPAKPADIATNKEARKAWSSLAAQVHGQNARYRSRRIAVTTTLHVARKFRDYDRIYFPHGVDFRGRVYPFPTGLQPQGDDMAKGLLQFAEGKPLGESGAYWLAVHIANLFGVDKVSFDDRVQWVLDNNEMICESALKPVEGKQFWLEADKPFCALAACNEWLGYRMEGFDYVSHLPIAMDGSCSGIQHFSALLRDKRGGDAVNLTPGEVPADLYTAVLDQVKDQLAESDSDIDQAWIGAATRKIVKRPCMTYAYSVTVPGITDQILDEMQKARPDGDEFLPGFHDLQAAQALARHTVRAIRATVISAAIGMDWLKDRARQLTDLGLPVIWQTPTGFPVRQANFATKPKGIDVYFQGREIRIKLAEDTKKLDHRRQLSGISPNFIHSMDAAHLMRTVNRCAEDFGITSFAMIHDSYGVHACCVDELHVAIREEFVRMYSEADWLAEFGKSMASALGVDVPDVPETGTLLLDAVLESDYFFA